MHEHVSFLPGTHVTAAEEHPSHFPHSPSLEHSFTPLPPPAQVQLTTSSETHSILSSPHRMVTAPTVTKKMTKLACRIEMTPGCLEKR
jgi:hypothetical protein